MQTSHNFHVTTKFEAIEGVEVSKFRSNKSGLSVVHVDVEGPIVEGAFALATEAHDDDGCPHVKSFFFLVDFFFLFAQNFLLIF